MVKYRLIFRNFKVLTDTSSSDVVRIKGPAIFADAISFVAIRFAERVVSASYLVTGCCEKQKYGIIVAIIRILFLYN